ncbi:helix-turn-helix transcriptional regulator [Rheinheimera sp. FR7-31]|uniref:helix-turn-helix domain-containing protein n=1 Tax=Rheinheimera fenheensis TaxID=3152295 RepID=UPI00325D6F4C
MQLNPQLIRQLRTDKGWTQQQLAEICALSLRTIQRIEVHGIASLESSKALAAAFDTEIRLLEQAISTESDEKGFTAVPVWVPIIAFIAGVVAGGGLIMVLSG